VIMEVTVTPAAFVVVFDLVTVDEVVLLLADVDFVVSDEEDAEDTVESDAVEDDRVLTILSVSVAVSALMEL
jgi:hypothetical protein